MSWRWERKTSNRWFKRCETPWIGRSAARRTSGNPATRGREKGKRIASRDLIEPGLEQGLGEFQLPDDAFARDALLLQAILNLLLRISPGQALLIAARQVFQRALAIELGDCEGRLLIHEDSGNQVFARHGRLLWAQFG